MRDLLDQNNDINIVGNCANCGVEYHIHQNTELKIYQGVLIGLKICKEMFAQNELTHENIYENEIYYRELIKNLELNIQK